MSVAKDAELWAVFGRRGSGKSTIVQGIARDPNRKKVVAFDPMREYTGRGWVHVSSLSQLVLAMKSRWRKGFRISYVPTAGDEAGDLHKLSSLLWTAQTPYERGSDPRKLTLIVEEANLGMPNHALPAGMNGMARLINQGRHRGLEAVAVSQRPALVSKTYRANCTKTFVFPLADETDRAEIGKVVGRSRMDELRQMQKFHFWQLEDGQVSAGRTKKTGGFTLT